MTRAALTATVLLVITPLLACAGKDEPATVVDSANAMSTSGDSASGAPESVDVAVDISKTDGSYRLTEAVMAKYAAAMRGLAELKEREPAVLSRINDEKTDPRIQAVFDKAGISEKEWRNFNGALTRAMLSSEANQADNLEAFRANVAFFTAHYMQFAEIPSL